MTNPNRHFIEFPGRSVGAVLEHLLHYPVLELVAPGERTLIIDAIHPGVTHEFIITGEHCHERELLEEVLKSYFFHLNYNKAEDRPADPLLMTTVLNRLLVQKGFVVPLPPPTERTFMWFVRTYSDLLVIVVKGSNATYKAQLERAQRYFQRHWAR